MCSWLSFLHRLASFAGKSTLLVMTLHQCTSAGMQVQQERHHCEPKVSAMLLLL